jgi:murein DD-endopeptidase MepM/ murein hydrolase activator NlpD
VAYVRSRTTKLCACVGALLALTIACALPPGASAGTGGSTYLSAPTIMRVTCASACPSGSDASTAKAKLLAVSSGSTIRVRGRRLRNVLKVQFAGGRKVRPVKKESSRIDVVVPADAKSGPVTLLEPRGKASKPSSTSLTMIKPPTRQTTGTILPGTWRIPLPKGYMVTSPFYEARSYEMHPGVDLAISSGTPIYAVGDGQVSQAGSYGGYGNYTCIAHSAAVKSCYAHQSAMFVSEGQNVTKGQLIGRVGCTGSCTGPHLHFEIRVNGAVRCPAPWVGVDSAKWCEAGSPGYGSTEIASKKAGARSASTSGWIDSKIRPPKGDAAD